MKTMASAYQKPGYRAAPTASLALGDSANRAENVPLQATAEDCGGPLHHEDLTKKSAPREDGAELRARAVLASVAEGLITLEEACGLCLGADFTLRGGA